MSSCCLVLHSSEEQKGNKASSKVMRTTTYRNPACEIDGDIEAATRVLARAGASEALTNVGRCSW